MIEIRCVKCHRLLMKGKIVIAEIKCPKCGFVDTVELFCDRDEILKQTQNNPTGRFQEIRVEVI